MVGQKWARERGNCQLGGVRGADGVRKPEGAVDLRMSKLISVGFGQSLRVLKT